MRQDEHDGADGAENESDADAQRFAEHTASKNVNHKFTLISRFSGAKHTERLHFVYKHRTVTRVLECILFIFWLAIGLLYF